jgi:hypothetical protein
MGKIVGSGCGIGVFAETDVITDTIQKKEDVRYEE